ncbi:hypothetical protein K435DRAFT_655292, partial [Dendrothele bispora CBS 962.96]
GYIGGCVLTKLFLNRKTNDENVTVLVRSAEKAEKLRKYGVVPVIGEFGNAELVERLASESDMVINVADSWDVNWTRDILRGLKKRYERTSMKPVLIHTSGAGVFIDDTKGLTLSEIIYDDMDVEQIASIPPEAPHRAVDLVVADADEEGYCQTYILVPGIVWGEAKTKLVKDGIQNPHTIPIPLITNMMLTIGQAAVIGKGVPRWCHVEVNEPADSPVLDTTTTDPVGHGRNGYFFGENGEFSWMELALEMGQILHSMDPSRPPTVRSYTQEEEEKYRYPYGYLWGTNARCVGNRSRALGWKPVLGTKEFLESVKDAAERWMKDEKIVAEYGANWQVTRNL